VSGFRKRATVQPVTFPEDESLDVGLDTRTAVAMIDYRYDVPFKFTGKIDKLTFHLEAEQHAESYLSR